MLYQDNSDNIKTDGMTVEASVYGNVFTENNIEIYYYEEPTYMQLSSYGSPANEEKPIFIKTDYKWTKNDLDKFEKFGNFTCRFSSISGNKTVYTKARMEFYPLGNEDPSATPSHVKCQSPKWKVADTAKLDVSVNGQDFSGDFTYTFFDVLDLYRIVPLAGPNEGKTRVKLYGSGLAATKDDVFVRWGVLDTEKILKEQVLDYIWNENDFITHAMVEGSEILPAYKKEAFSIEKKDYELAEGDKLKTYVSHAPRPNNWNATHGGPIYLSVGEHLVLNVSNYSFEENPTGGDLLMNVSYFNRTIFSYS